MLTELFLVLFVGLKLTNHIDWPWFWVLSPLWIGAVLGIVIGVLNGLTNEYEDSVKVAKDKNLWFGDHGKPDNKQNKE